MTGPPAVREPAIDHLAEVWGSIGAACEDLRPAEWDEATDCPGWAVRDHLAHLIGIERMLLGEPPAPPLDEYPAHVHNPIGEMNEAWVESRRGTPGPDVLLEFREVTERRLEELRSLTPERLDVVSENLLGRMSYRQFVRTRVVDSWAHEQDIRRAVGRPGGRNGAGESVVMEGCARNMGRVVAKAADAPDGSVVAFVISGLLGRQLAVTVAAGRGSVHEPPGDEEPTTTLSMDQETFLRLCFGRVEPLRLLGTGEVRVDGDVVVGHKVLEAMGYMP